MRHRFQIILGLFAIIVLTICGIAFFPGNKSERRLREATSDASENLEKKYLRVLKKN